jgi:hypothetical protein
MLARAFAAEGVEVLFTLMGDANMYWSVAMSKLPGMKVVHARHEHCAVAMADGYARATGKVGVASTTCGPGFTQIMTALTISARSNTPLVVFAGDAPLASSWYIQQIDMAPLALACGAHYVGVKHIDRVLDNVREAFQVALTERKPVFAQVQQRRHQLGVRLQAFVVARIRVEDRAHLGDCRHRRERRPVVDAVHVGLGQLVFGMRSGAQPPVEPDRLRIRAVRRQRRSRDAHAGAARAARRARGAVAAGERVVGVQAARDRVAAVGRADVAIIAVRRGSAVAGASAARVVRGAGVPVVAGIRVVGMSTALAGIA